MLNPGALSAPGVQRPFHQQVFGVHVRPLCLYAALLRGWFSKIRDTLLDDIVRIRVPGATLREANAVNGVISIITKHNRDTTSALGSVTGGSETFRAPSVRATESALPLNPST